MMSETLFLFAHQDDEFGVFQKIIDELAVGRIVYCAYLTDGVPIGHSPKKRNLESISVLTNLGVPPENILFIGERLSIPDGQLVDNMTKAKDWLSGWLSQTSNMSHIYLPAWEGGHPDHDSLHVIGVIVAKESNLLNFVWQYPLYNGYQCRGQLFRVLLPLPSNSEVINKKISWRNRYRFMGLTLCYPSQARTWIGLLPFVLLHYVFFGTQSLQRVSVSQILLPPHVGSLYYERRKFCTWTKMSERLREIY
jgi:LmbE family N-acetylglucosaminyl deacetylase